MKKYTYLLMCVILLFLLGCQKKEQQEQAEAVTYTGAPVKIGFMICDSLEETTERFRPIAQFLSNKTGREFIPIMANTFEFEDLVKNKKIDFFHGNSLLAIAFKEQYGMEFLTVDKRGRNGHKASGTIIALADSGIKSYEDMKGKTMVFGPALAPFGYMAQYYMMVQHGIDPEEDLAYYAIPWGAAKHEKVIYGVLFGRYDLGAAPRIDVDLMVKEGKINLDDFVIIDESIPMPYCTIGYLKGTDVELAQKVKQALLGLTEEDTVKVDDEVVNVVKRSEIDGFVEAVDSEYEPIRERMKRLNMSPYQKFE